jgi:SAM-dependent methyltransferase
MVGAAGVVGAAMACSNLWRADGVGVVSRYSCLFELARLVASGGRVLGVDVSESMINSARDRAAAQNLNVEFEVGDAQALRFADKTFDACRTKRMLMHVPDADRAVAEMVRVIRADRVLGATSSGDGRRAGRSRRQPKRRRPALETRAPVKPAHTTNPPIGRCRPSYTTS